MNADSSQFQNRSEQEKVRVAYEEHREGLTRFLLGVLGNSAEATDALQQTFCRFLEKGNQIQNQESVKSWLYRVAMNEALQIRRAQSTGRKHAKAIAWKLESTTNNETGDRMSQCVRHAILQEEILRVRSALKHLSPPQREVVTKRIYDGLKFKEIAQELDVPLGTVLARMQAALKKLKPYLKQNEI